MSWIVEIKNAVDDFNSYIFMCEDQASFTSKLMNETTTHKGHSEQSIEFAELIESLWSISPVKKSTHALLVGG